MNVLFSKEELLAKGIKRKDVVRVLESSERVCNYYFKLSLSKELSSKEQQAWDNETSKWDHFKATLQKWND